MAINGECLLEGEPLHKVVSLEAHSRAILLSLIGLIVAILGLGLAVIPSIAMERAIPNPFENQSAFQTSMLRMTMKMSAR